MHGVNKLFFFGYFFFSVGLPLRATLYPVGPGYRFTNIGDAPLDSLTAGDTVLIHARPAPYNEKWVICAEGTESAPVVFRGVPDSAGALPVIDGRNAVTKPGMNFWSEGRGVIKIGGSNNPPDCMPSHIVVENLNIRSGRQPYRFTGRDGDTTYTKNAAALFLEKGEHITIRNCTLHDCANGLFSASQTSDVLVEGCHIYDNGVDSSIYEHNSYTESFGITFQYNHYGPLRTGCPGNNLKDRSAGCVIRYNRIEAGNRQLDLVDSDYASFYDDPSYRTTFVYGNILIEPDGAGNSQICHYGGDSGTQTHYRRGTLHFYHNTVISARTGNTTLFRLSTDDETVDCRNNVLYTTAAGSRLAVVDDNGTADLRNNWLKEGWKISHSNTSADVNDLGGQITGTFPGFTDTAGGNFTLAPGSACIDAGTGIAAAASAYPVVMQYAADATSALRIDPGLPDIGALTALSSAVWTYGNTVPAGLSIRPLADSGWEMTLPQPAFIRLHCTGITGTGLQAPVAGWYPAGTHRILPPRKESFQHIVFTYICINSSTAILLKNFNSSH